MKVDDKKLQFRSDVAGTSVRMGIAEGSEAHIMDIMSRMYGDPELAIVREYSTNALDSQVEAGYDGPIEVTLPTPFAPTFTIRDYGIGLDADGIFALYSQYGASSKRNTNAAQGMLGIGCKSALAYTDQFTVIGYKDGLRTTVIVSRDEDGGASQHILETHQGDHRNGVEVTIPVKPDNEIAEKAKNFYRFWPEGTVLLKQGDRTWEPQRIGTIENGTEDEDGGEYRNVWLDDRTLLTNEVSEDLVVMGYVAYPLVDGDEELFDSPSTGGRQYDYKTSRYIYPKSFNAVCFVDIGDVNFAPSRESLMATKRTKAKLDELRKHVAATRDSSILSQIANASNAKEAQELLLAARSVGFDAAKTPPKWQGREVVTVLKRTLPAAPTGATYSLDAGSADVEKALKYSFLFTDVHRKDGERAQTLKLDQPRTIFTGFDGKWLTNVKRAKLELWSSQNGIDVKRAVFIDKLSSDEKFWTSGWPVYDWAEVYATELPKTAMPDGTTKRLKGSYDAVVNGTNEHGIPAHKIDTKKPLYYIHGNLWGAKAHLAVRTGAVDITNATVVALPANRIEKFQRDFPTAVQLNHAAQEAAKAWKAKIDPDQVKAYSVQQHRAETMLAALKGEDFNDPSLNTLIRLASADCSTYEDDLGKYQSWVGAEDRTNVWAFIERTLKKYPLVEWNTYSEPTGKKRDHLILYLNAVATP